MPRIIYPAHFEPVSILPNPATLGWFSALATPLRIAVLTTAVVAASGAVLPPSQAKETTTLDRWHAPLSLPTPPKPALHASQRQAFTWHVSTAPEATTVSRWYVPLATPVLQPRALHTSLQQAHTEPVSLLPETTTVDRWWQPLSLFPGARAGLSAANQQPFVWHVSTAKETTTLDRWYSPLSLFPGAKPGLSAANQQPFIWHISTARETTTLDRWWQPLSLPTPPRAGLHASRQLAFTWQISIASEPATLDRWYSPFSLPVWRRTLSVAAQPSVFAPPVQTVNLSADFIVTSEWRSAPIADTANGIEWRTTFTVDSIAPAEWFRSSSIDYVFPAEWRASPISDGSTPAEWRLSLIGDSSAPVEWGLSVRLDQVEPAEFTSTIRLDQIEPIEPSLTIRRDDAVVSEWRVAQAFDGSMPIEWRAAPFFDAVIPIQWSATTLIDAILLKEPLTSVIREPIMPTEFGMGIVRDFFQVADWTGPVAVSLDVCTWVEWRASVIADRSAHEEILATEVASSTTGSSIDQIYQSDTRYPVEWLIRFSSADTVSPIEFTSVRISDVGSGASWIASIFADTIVPIDYSGTVLRTSFGDSIAPLEFISTLRTDVNHPIEFASGITVTLVGWADPKFSLASNANTPLSFIAPTASADTLIPVDFNGIISLVINDDRLPLEFTTSVAHDVTLSTDWPWPARRAKGSTIGAQPISTSKPIAEGHGPKGNTLKR